MIATKETLVAVLAEFILDIETLGGVYVDRRGLHRLLCDPDWIDLAETYMKACRVLDQKPLVEDFTADDDEEEFNAES